MEQRKRAEEELHQLGWKEIVTSYTEELGLPLEKHRTWFEHEHVRTDAE